LTALAVLNLITAAKFMYTIVYVCKHTWYLSCSRLCTNSQTMQQSTSDSHHCHRATLIHISVIQSYAITHAPRQLHRQHSIVHSTTVPLNATSCCLISTNS